MHRPRDQSDLPSPPARQSPLYRLIERYFPEFQRTYNQRYQDHYGPWRPIIGEVVRRFLTCGDLHYGFARVRCNDGPHEMFVPFSCRQRCLCPSCHQKRTLLAADMIARTICGAVPHRQIVLTIPKQLRIYFRFNRPLLGDLARATWETVVDVYCSVLGRDDILPGMIAGIQTFDQLAHFHPHVHSIFTDGGFDSDGTFICLPKIDTDDLCTVWQTKVFKMLLEAEKIDGRTADEMRAWAFSVFSVDHSVYLSSGDTFALERLTQCILRCPFSLSRIVRLADNGSVIYRAEKDDCRRFSGAASGDLRGGPSRNFQVFSALDFLAELMQHISEKGEHLVRYYGWYSHLRRGIRAKLAKAKHSRDQPPIDRSALEAEQSASRPPAGFLPTWAMLIKRILRHCGFWEGPMRTLAGAPWATERLGARPARAARVAVSARSGVSVAAQPSLFLRRQRDSFPPGTRAAQLARPGLQRMLSRRSKITEFAQTPANDPPAPPIHARFTKALTSPLLFEVFGKRFF